MTTTLAIPASAADITAGWLTHALRAGGAIAAGVTVTKLDTEPVGVGIGLVGALARLTPTYAGGGGPATVVAKFVAADEGNRFVANVLGMYRKEVGFYRTLSAKARLPHSACFYADHDDSTDEFVLLLEDLAGGRVVDQIDGCGRADAEAAIDALADFHAGFWNDTALAETGWLGALCDAPFPDAIAMSYEPAWGVVQELFGEDLTPEVKAFGDQYTERLPSIVARLSEGPVTLSHGDFRLDNIFFAADGDQGVPLRVCDWQLVDRSRGARDLAYFLSQSLVPDLRLEMEKGLVQRYVDGLAAKGVEDYPLDLAWDDYRLATAFAFAYPVVAGGGLDHADERATALCRGMLQRAVRAIVETDALSVV
jgi:hypothetical protein